VRRKRRVVTHGLDLQARSLLLAHDLFGKPLHTRRVKPEGMLFRIMR
jgi:hypothetical protein